jgi:hypothetical protein
MDRTDRNRRYYEKNRERLLAAKAARDIERRAEVSAYNAAYYTARKAAGSLKLRRPKSRQEWLDAALAEAKNILAEHGAKVPDAFTIRLGVSGRQGLTGQMIWCSQLIEIYRPLEGDEDEVELLGTILHEAVHAAEALAYCKELWPDREDDWTQYVGGCCAHGPAFKQLARACGLIGCSAGGKRGWGFTVCGPELREHFTRWIAAHGHFQRLSSSDAARLRADRLAERRAAEAARRASQQAFHKFCKDHPGWGGEISPEDLASKGYLVLP